MPASTVGSGSGSGASGSQLPMAWLPELHICPEGQPLPPSPRHPSTHSWLCSSHTRPESLSPQSLSSVQPQRLLVRQRAPASWPSQAASLDATHCTQRMVETSQT